MHKSAKPSSQCAHVEAEKEANLTVGSIQRRIVNLVKDTVLRLYCTSASLDQSWNTIYRYSFPETGHGKLKEVRTRARYFLAYLNIHTSVTKTLSQTSTQRHFAFGPQAHEL